METSKSVVTQSVTQSAIDSVLEETVKVRCGDTLVDAVRSSDGRTWVTVRSVCAGLGLVLAGQLEKLHKSAPESVVCVMYRTAADGKKYLTYCVSTEYLPTWLGRINPGKVRPELAPLLARYSAELHRAVTDYFLRGAGRAVCAELVGVDAPGHDTWESLEANSPEAVRLRAELGSATLRLSALTAELADVRARARESVAEAVRDTEARVRAELLSVVVDYARCRSATAPTRGASRVLFDPLGVA
jgi:hypothetical protein